ncbi:uncharacterized protein LOC141627078 [Silene latifolia]|uniref:uncharacterized protein LOC141627078 n=1 Tax=Silene latifolia TaxID=37657 RepID=UPI003D788924
MSFFRKKNKGNSVKAHRFNMNQHHFMLRTSKERARIRLIISTQLLIIQIHLTISSTISQNLSTTSSKTPNFTIRPNPTTINHQFLQKITINQKLKPAITARNQVDHLISNCSRLEFNNNKRRFANNVQENMGPSLDNSGFFSGYQQGLAGTSSGASNSSSGSSGLHNVAGHDISPGMYNKLQTALHVSTPTDTSNIGSANFAGLFYEDANDSW